MIDPTNRNSAQASALVGELARGGVEHAALSPGSRSSPIAMALEREPSISVTVILDERSAGFHALGVALAGGRPAVVACTSGSAAANLHPAIVEADEAGVPLIALTSDRPPELRGVGAGQAIDQIKLFGSAVRLFVEAGNHEADDTGLLHYRALAVRAIAAAKGHRSRPGPVQVNLPWRDPLGPEPRPDDVTATSPLALGGRGARPLTVPIPGHGPAPALVSALVDRMRSADRILIVAGRNRNSSLPDAVRQLAATIGAPVLADPTSGLRFGDPGEARLVAAYDSIARAALGDAAVASILAPDLILRFGDTPTSKHLRAWLGGFDDAEIAIDTPREWDEPSRTAAAVVAADAALVAEALVAAGERSSSSEYAGAWRLAEQAAWNGIENRLGKESDLNEPAIHRAIAAAFASGERCLLASSMPIRDHESFVPAGRAAIDVLSNRGANGIDGLVSTAAGIAAAGSPTWAILGDLALAHDIGGLAVAAQVASPLRLVVINNGGGGIFDFLPQAEQVEGSTFERLFTTPSGLNLEKAADLYGIRHVAVGSSGELSAALTRTEHPILIEAQVDRAGNVALHREIHDAAIAAVRAALD